VLVDEHFQEVAERGGGLPDAWTGDAFRVVRLKEEPVLQLSKGTSAAVDVRLPQPIKCNFSIAGRYAFSDRTQFDVLLEDRRTGAMKRIGFNQNGVIEIDKEQDAPLPAFYVSAPIRFVIKLEGTTLTVSLDGQIAATKYLNEVAEYDTLRLSMYYGVALSYLMVVNLPP
jgi:hypothetical protein